MVVQEVEVSRAVATDLDEIVAVGARALGWPPQHPNRAVFEWKHAANPYGASAIWVARSNGLIVAYRAMMRWELADPAGRVWRCVRAVDTATLPEFQRRGIFSRLTLGAVDELTKAGVDIVFNTPNEKSRPGYLKMGWFDVGRLPVAFRPTGIRGLANMVSARTSASKWPASTATGSSVESVVTDPALVELIEGQPAPSGLATVLSPALLAWRYGAVESLGYRCWAPHGPDAGVVFFRVRERGKARECTVGHVLAPGGARPERRRLVAELARAVDADYLLVLGDTKITDGVVRFSVQGPRLMARPLASIPPDSSRAWSLTMGDIELF